MVIWTPQEKADLKAIYSYISKNSPLNAKKVVTEIINKADNFLALPQEALGKKTPEINQDDIREINIHSWRIIYLTTKTKRHVLTVFHFRRELNTKDLKLESIQN